MSDYHDDAQHRHSSKGNNRCCCAATTVGGAVMFAAVIAMIVFAVDNTRIDSGLAIQLCNVTRVLWDREETELVLTDDPGHRIIYIDSLPPGANVLAADPSFRWEGRTMFCRKIETKHDGDRWDFSEQPPSDREEAEAAIAENFKNIAIFGSGGAAGAGLVLIALVWRCCRKQCNGQDGTDTGANFDCPSATAPDSLELTNVTAGSHKPSSYT